MRNKYSFHHWVGVTRVYDKVNFSGVWRQIANSIADGTHILLDYFAMECPWVRRVCSCAIGTWIWLEQICNFSTHDPHHRLQYLDRGQEELWIQFLWTPCFGFSWQIASQNSETYRSPAVEHHPEWKNKWNVRQPMDITCKNHER